MRIKSFLLVAARLKKENAKKQYLKNNNEKEIGSPQIGTREKKKNTYHIDSNTNMSLPQRYQNSKQKLICDGIVKNHRKN